MQAAIAQSRRSLFKSVLSLAVGLMAWLAAVVAAHAQPSNLASNLASNPGFEGAGVVVNECANVSGVVAPGWSDNTCWDTARPQISYALDAASPHGGAQSQRVTLLSGSRAQFAQYLPAAARGNLYRVTVWLRAQADMDVTLGLRQAGAPYSGYGSKLAVLSTGWQAFEFEGIASADSMVLLIIAKQPGTFWIDDVVVSDAGAVASTLPSPPTAPVPRAYFGMHFNELDSPWPQTGAAPGAVRVWDAGPNRDNSGVGAQWTEINPQRGVYDWSGLDARVAAAAAQGADVIYTLGGRTPRWASSQPDTPTPYGPGQCAEPSSEALWQDWVRAIVTRYQGRIRYWEIWNEPDLPDFYCGRAARLVDLSRLAKEVINAVDPAARVVSPAMSGYEGTGALDAFLSSGGGAFVDIIGYHFYVDKPEDVSFKAIALKALLERYGAQNLPLWNTEQGWIDTNLPVDVLPEATGAAYVARSVLLAWAWGQQRHYYYTWDNPYIQIPMTTGDRRTLSSAGASYREVSRWLLGSTMQSVQRDGAGNYVVTLADGGGVLRRVMWNPDTDGVAFTPPAEWRARVVRDLQGKSRSLRRRSSVGIGASPVLFE
jgi:hypothetical protein